VVSVGTAAIWERLDQVLDPEVPVLSVVELGIVRDVEVDAQGTVTVSVTPTYSGCPTL
jgi:ring-1,2-phenylacetyl-CoA epoxidase subunit PaaD